MKKIFFLFLIFSINQVFSDDDILSCVTKSNQEMLIKLGQNNLLIHREVQEIDYETRARKTIKEKIVFNLLGLADLSRDPKVKKMRVVAYDINNTGKNYLSLAVLDRDKIKAYLTTDMSGSRYDCKALKKFHKFEQILKKLKVVSRDEFYDYTDSSLALKCFDSKKQAYNIRAFESSYGRGSIQVRPQFKNSGSGIFDLSSDDLVMSGNKIIFYSPHSRSLSNLVVINTETKNADGSLVVQVSSSQNIARLKCFKKWAYSKNILQRGKEFKKLPKKLPQPGSIVDLKRDVSCNYDKANLMYEKYSHLINIKGASALSVTDVDEHPLGKGCYALMFYSSSNEVKAEVKKVLGESLNGLFVTTGDF